MERILYYGSLEELPGTAALNSTLSYHLLGLEEKGPSRVSHACCFSVKLYDRCCQVLVVNFAFSQPHLRPQRGETNDQHTCRDSGISAKLSGTAFHYKTSLSVFHVMATLQSEKKQPGIPDVSSPCCEPCRPAGEVESRARPEACTA